MDGYPPMKTMPDHAPSVLPLSLAPRGLSRVQAAEYIGVGVSKFDQMVEDGRMPRPKRVDARTIWDRFELDAAFAALDPWGQAIVRPGASNEWDDL